MYMWFKIPHINLAIMTGAKAMKMRIELFHLKMEKVLDLQIYRCHNEIHVNTAEKVDLI